MWKHNKVFVEEKYSYKDIVQVCIIYYYKKRKIEVKEERVENVYITEIISTLRLKKTTK